MASCQGKVLNSSSCQGSQTFGHQSHLESLLKRRLLVLRPRVSYLGPKDLPLQQAPSNANADGLGTPLKKVLGHPCLS